LVAGSIPAGPTIRLTLFAHGVPPVDWVRVLRWKLKFFFFEL